MVEAYIERSEEARQIVAGFKALGQLSDESVLNPQSDYWEKSAARIEAVLGDAGHTKITPVKKSGWSEWGWKAVSLAASVVLLTYVGFHSDEILYQTREEPKSTLVIPDKVREDQSIQSADQESLSQEQMKESEPTLTETEAAPPVLIPKPVDETGRQRAVPVSLVEPSKNEKNKKKQIEETAVTIDQIDQPVGQDEEVSHYKVERVKSKSEIRTSGEVSLGEENKAPVIKLYAPSRVQTPVVDSIDADLDQIELPEEISEELEGVGERLTFYDSTSADATEEERSTYYWNHVISVRQDAMRAVHLQIESFDGAYQSLSTGLKDSGGRSGKSAKKGKRQEKEDEQRALEQERKLIDAAFYMGKKADKRGTALKFLKYMATENDETLDKAYALKKWEELRDM